jgi:hypothetical protein
MRVFTCRTCSRIHLEVGNTQIHFADVNSLKAYLERLEAVDVAYFAAINRSKGLTKVIIIPLTEDGSVHLGFTEDEFEELKLLIRNYLNSLNCRNSSQMMSFKEFQNNWSLN